MGFFGRDEVLEVVGSVRVVVCVGALEAGDDCSIKSRSIMVVLSMMRGIGSNGVALRDVLLQKQLRVGIKSSGFTYGTRGQCGLRWLLLVGNVRSKFTSCRFEGWRDEGV